MKKERRREKMGKKEEMEELFNKLNSKKLLMILDKLIK